MCAFVCFNNNALISPGLNVHDSREKALCRKKNGDLSYVVAYSLARKENILASQLNCTLKKNISITEKGLLVTMRSDSICDNCDFSKDHKSFS